jgi:hypothetical protein
MRILLCCLFVVLTSTTLVPKSEDPPPPDAKTVLALTPSSEGLRKRYGPANSESDVLDVFTVRPDIKITVQYGSDHHACHIELTPPDPHNPYMPTEKVSVILDEVAPPAMRGKLTNSGVVQSSECGKIESFVYENVGIGRVPNVCAPEHPNTVRNVTVQFTRDVCKNR